MRVFMTSSSFPRDAKDWKATFIRSMLTSLANRPDLELAFWGPSGELPPAVSYAANADDAKWFEKLLGDGGIANILRKKNINSILAASSLLFRLRNAYRTAQNADVIHANWLQCALPLRRKGKPLLVTVLGTDYGLLKLPGIVFLLRRVFRDGPCIVAPNADWMVPQLQDYFGDVASVRCIPFGIDKEWFEVKRDLAADTPRRWLLVSRLARAKIGPLFEWADDLFLGNDELHILGPMQEKIDLPKWAFYHGPTNPRDLQTVHFGTATGLLTLSQHDEGRPQVMLEAMAAGLPIVASPLKAHLDIIDADKTGMIVNSRDEFRAALEKLAIRAENRRIGANAQLWVKTQLGTWDDCARRYADAYSSLASMSR